MHKFAADLDLITTIDHYDEIKDELEHVGAWTDKNNLLLNKSKTREMIICKGKPVILPPPTVGIERVTSMKKLGVTIQSNLSMKDHVDKLMAKSSNMIYAMNILRNHGMQGKELQQIFNSKILSRIMYALPAWYGMASKEDIKRINAFLNRSKKFGLYPEDGKSFQELCDEADQKPFRKVQTNEQHVMHKFIPETKNSIYELSLRKHNFILPDKDDRNFINRLLYENK